MSTISASTTSTTAYKVTADTTGTLVLQTGASPTTAVTIDTSQNVGMGAIPSTSKLRVESTGGAASATFATTASRAALQITSDTGLGTGTKLLSGIGSSSYCWFQVQNSNDNATYDLALNPIGGSVGIGTVPSYKFDVLGSTSRFYFDSVSNSVTLDGNGTNRDLTFYARYANTATLQTDGYWIFKTSNAERMRLDTSGNLLVGTTSVSAKFCVQTSGANQGVFSYNVDTATTSSYLFWGYANGASRFIVYGNGNVQNVNNSYGAISDVKLKENITDATPKLEQLNQVRIVNYNLIGDENKQLGVIAQELEQVFPSMVEESVDRDAEGNDLGTTTKSVKYSVFVPMLIKAIQELNEKVEAQAAEIATLKGAA